MDFMVERVILPQRSQSHKHSVSPNHSNTKKSIYQYLRLCFIQLRIIVTTAHHSEITTEQYGNLRMKIEAVVAQ